MPLFTIIFYFTPVLLLCINDITKIVLFWWINLLEINIVFLAFFSIGKYQTHVCCGTIVNYGMNVLSYEQKYICTNRIWADLRSILSKTKCEKKWQYWLLILFKILGISPFKWRHRWTSFGNWWLISNVLDTLYRISHRSPRLGDYKCTTLWIKLKHIVETINFMRYSFYHMFCQVFRKPLSFL